MLKLYSAAILALLTLVILIPALPAQNSRPMTPAAATPPVYGMPGTGFPSDNNVPPAVERHMQNQMNQSRQVELKRDTDQLMQMASELKQQVDQTGPAILSMDVIKKAERIEKLAKSVRERMKGN